MSEKFLSGLILAAGASTRLGQPKQLLEFKGTTLLEWVSMRIESCAALDETIVVLGTNAELIRGRVQFGRSKVVINPGTEKGCSASYRVGIEACRPDTNALVVLLGDQPEVDPEIIETITSEWRRQDKGKIMLVSYNDKRGHPMIFSRELFPLLVDLHGDKAVWKLVDQHPEWVREVKIDRPCPRDINTWEDYLAVKGN